MIAPLQVWQAWNDNDLLGFDPPKEEETYAQYRDRIGDDAFRGIGYFISFLPNCALRTCRWTKRTAGCSVPSTTFGRSRRSWTTGNPSAR